MNNDVLNFLKVFSTEETEDDCHSADTIAEAESITTGSIALDVALGCGGWPKGRITQIYGQTASGKSLLCLLAIKTAQKLDSNAQQVWIDAEQTFNPKWATQIGIDLSRLVVIEGEKAQNGRQCFEILLGLPKEDTKTHAYLGKKQNGLFDEIAAGNLNVNFIVLDSLGALIPPIDDVASVGKASMASLSRFLSKELKRVSLDVKKAKVPFVIINHVRSTLDPYSSSDHCFSGGNAYAHFLSANIFIKPISKKDTQVLDEKENKIGHTLRAVIEKTKFGPWPRTAEFKLDFIQGIVDTHEEIIQVALEKDIIIKPTTMSYEFGDKKWVGMPKLVEAVKEDLELQNALVEKIKETLVKKTPRVETEEVKVSKRKKKEE